MTFETNNWYNDISTRDRSREGAEGAIDLSRKVSKTRIIKLDLRARESQSGSRADGRGYVHAAEALKLDINSLPQDRVSGVSPRVFWHS